MPFPFIPSAADNEYLFPIHDPFRLRRSILPLFALDRDTGILNGIGTAFRIDPFGTCLDAKQLQLFRDALMNPGSEHDKSFCTVTLPHDNICLG